MVCPAINRKDRKMKSSFSILIVTVLLCLVSVGGAKADSSDGLYESRWRVAVAGSYGFMSTFDADQSGWDMTPQRKNALFEPAVSVSMRFGRISGQQLRFKSCIDLSFYYFSVPLSTYFENMDDLYAVDSYHLGYIRSAWLVFTPGWQRLDLNGSGLSVFLGLAGVGISVSQFSTNPYLEGEAAEQANQIKIGSGFILALVPAKAEWVVARKVFVGVAFSGILMSGPSIEAGPETETWRTPDGEKLNLSSVQLHMTLGVWL